MKWIGIIKGDLTKYEQGNLDTKAKKMKFPESMKEMQIKALPFMILPFIIIFLSMFIKCFVSKQFVINPFCLIVGFLLGLLLLIVHEVLHGIVYPKEADVLIGLYPKTFAAVVLASYPLKRGRFILMSLLPMILGIVPIVIFWLTPADMHVLNGLIFGISLLGLISPYPDYYTTYQILRHTPKNCSIQFYNGGIYWIEENK